MTSTALTPATQARCMKRGATLGAHELVDSDGISIRRQRLCYSPSKHDDATYEGT